MSMEQFQIPEGQQLEEGKLYLQLFHGRKKPSENLEDWGSIGPVFGPIGHFQFTYGTLRMEKEGTFIDAGIDLRKSKSIFDERLPGSTELHRHEDLIHYDGVFYGDFSIFIAKEGETPMKGT